MTPILNLIEQQRSRLKEPNISSTERIGILYNLAFLNFETSASDSNYPYIKEFIKTYVSLVETEKYGYEEINYRKIKQLIGLVSYGEQISLLSYAISIISREFPQTDVEKLLQMKHQAEIKKILNTRKVYLYPKAILLLSSKNSIALILALFLLFAFTCIILLPATMQELAIFEIQKAKFSENFFLNHILNVLTAFADIDSGFKIVCFNWQGVLLMVTGKIIFLVFIVNFIYIKISDKISLK